MKRIKANLPQFWGFLFNLFKILGVVTSVKLLFFSNVDRSDSYFLMSFLNVYYIIMRKLHEKYWILNQVENLKVCYLRMITLVMAHFILDLTMNPSFIFSTNSQSNTSIQISFL
jgi:hypothetical protein